jgi:hypothetical protein
MNFNSVTVLWVGNFLYTDTDKTMISRSSPQEGTSLGCRLRDSLHIWRIATSIFISSHGQPVGG